jgi:hypothetical protein
MIHVTALRGQGFVIKKRNIKKDDAPNTYCIIQKNASKVEWKTATIKDNCVPQWNETRDSTDIDPTRSNIRDNVYDTNGRRGKDDLIGSAKFLVESLLRKRLMEIELWNGTTPTKSYLTLTCVQLTANKEITSGVGDVLIHCQPERRDEGMESIILTGTGNSNVRTRDDKERADGDITTPLTSPYRALSNVEGLAMNSIDDGSMVSTCSNTNKPSRRTRIRKLSGRLLKKMAPTPQ